MTAPTRAPRDGSLVLERSARPWGAALATLWRFGRPHTLIGTSLAVLTLFVLAALTSRAVGPSTTSSDFFTASTLLTLAATWVATLAANLYVVGLNQLCDVPIDRINKPHLPLPAGAVGPAMARAWVAAGGGLALLLALLGGPWLLATILFALGIGTGYSLPPWRWKHRAAPAAVAIALVRGPALHLGVYAHLASRLGASPRPTPAVLTLAAFATLFALAVAVAKDVSDVDGDRHHAIQTVAASFGPRVAVRMTWGFLAAAYASASALALLLAPSPWSASLAAAHIGLLGIASHLTWRLDVGHHRSSGRWYRALWGLFYVEYIVVMILRATLPS